MHLTSAYYLTSHTKDVSKVPVFYRYCVGILPYRMYSEGPNVPPLGHSKLCQHIFYWNEPLQSNTRYHSTTTHNTGTACNCEGNPVNVMRITAACNHGDHEVGLPLNPVSRD